MPGQYTLPFQHGALVLFSGRGIKSQGIRWRTWSPYSHVGQLVYVTSEHLDDALETGVLDLPFDRIPVLMNLLGDGAWLIFESTTLAPKSCFITGERISGVQAHPATSRIRNYNGRVWLLPWVDDWQLTESEADALALGWLGDIGTPYDYQQAIWSGTIFWPWSRADASSLFCSEGCARRIQRLDKPRLPVSASSKWSPARLVREVRGNGRAGERIFLGGNGELAV